MPTTLNNYSISEVYDYSLCQLAAEAFLNKATQPGELDYSDSNKLTDVLTQGNKHTSKFTEDQAIDFLNKYSVLATIPDNNCESGFSGVLLRNNTTGEIVFSIRSTEFVDDYVRDNTSTNAIELKDHGFAFGQIADMQKYLDQWAADPYLIPPGSRITVTGYSLGGSLAQSCAMLYPDLVEKVYTFNGAGVGLVNSGSTLNSVMAEFKALRDPNSSYFLDQIQDSFSLDFLDTATAIWREVTGPGFSSLPESSIIDKLSRYRQQLSELSVKYTGSILEKLEKALANMQTIATQSAYLRTLSSLGDGAGDLPLTYSLSNVTQFDLRYQLAMITASRNTSNGGNIQGAINMYSGIAYAPTPLDNIPVYNISGCSSLDNLGNLSMVAYSQYHYGSPDTQYLIPIENQPYYRGTAIKDAAAASFVEKDFTLLVDGYGVNDFGDTHSIVLIIDSLLVQKSLASIFPQFNDTAFHK